MAALLGHTAKMLADPFHEGIEHGLDVIAMAKLYEHLGDWETAARLFEKGLQMSLGEDYFWQAVQRLAVLQKRRGDFEQAIPLWEQAAADGHVYAYVELAKFHEHKRRDPAAALDWTKSALRQLKQAGLPSYVRKHWEQELRHRRERLEAKVRKK
jgi:tetratricopeptide (TPR) repeat protein